MEAQRIEVSEPELHARSSSPRSMHLSVQYNHLEAFLFITKIIKHNTFTSDKLTLLNSWKYPKSLKIFLTYTSIIIFAYLVNANQ